MRIMCYKCGEFMEVEKTGVTVRPRNYRFGFHADLWKCPKCGTRILILAEYEDPSIIHPDIIYLNEDEERIYDEKTYEVTGKLKVTVEAEDPDEAIDRALEEFEEMLNSKLNLEDILDIEVSKNGD